MVLLENGQNQKSISTHESTNKKVDATCARCCALVGRSVLGRHPETVHERRRVVAQREREVGHSAGRRRVAGGARWGWGILACVGAVAVCWGCGSEAGWSLPACCWRLRAVCVCVCVCVCVSVCVSGCRLRERESVCSVCFFGYRHEPDVCVCLCVCARAPSLLHRNSQPAFQRSHYLYQHCNLHPKP